MKHFDIKANWIKASKLPERAGQYLVIWTPKGWHASDADRIGIAYFSRKTRTFGLRGSVFRGGWYDLNDEVSYWMRLPEMPEEVKKNS